MRHSRWSAVVAAAGVSLALAMVTVPTASSSVAGSSVPAKLSSSDVYRDVGFDPKDVPTYPGLYVRKSERSVVRLKDGRHLRIKVWAVDAFRKHQGSDTGVAARLDTRGDRSWDYTVDLFLGDAGSNWAPACIAFRPSGRTLDAGPPRFWKSGAVSCTVRLAELKQAHRPHWRLLAYDVLQAIGNWGPIYDHAPDKGWYR